MQKPTGHAHWLAWSFLKQVPVLKEQDEVDYPEYVEWHLAFKSKKAVTMRTDLSARLEAYLFLGLLNCWYDPKPDVSAIHREATWVKSRSTSWVTYCHLFQTWLSL